MEGPQHTFLIVITVMFRYTLLSPFFPKFLFNFFSGKSQTKYIGTRQKFTNFAISTPVPQSQCWDQTNFGKKAFQNQHWVQGEGGGSVEEESYEICDCSIYFFRDCSLQNRFRSFTQEIHLLTQVPGINQWIHFRQNI